MTTQCIDQTNDESAVTVPVKVWDVPTRVFHWLLAGSFAGAWLTAESERWRDIHVMLGYTLAGLIAFRIVWGVVGSRYARFSSFVFPPSRVWSYLKSLFGSAPEHHAGHNPAGALAIFLLLGLGLVASASGFAIYQEIGGAGWAERLEDLHEVAANTMLAVVLVHLVGVLLSSLLHRENLVRSMITGNKQGRPGEGIVRSGGWFGIALLVAVLGFWTADRAGWLGSGEPTVAQLEQGLDRRGQGDGEHRAKQGRDRDD